MIDAEDCCLIVEDNYLIFTDIEDIVMASGFKLIDHASTLAEAETLLEKINIVWPCWIFGLVCLTVCR